MIRAGLQEKLSLEVEGFVEYNGAASAPGLSLLGSGKRGCGDVTGGIYLSRWQPTRTALGDSGADDVPAGNDSQIFASRLCAH
jgi:hypothetical protein